MERSGGLIWGAIGYQGYLVADAHVVYDHLYATGDVIEVNCWAHSRRYFFKALNSDPDRAKVALGFIGALFRIERTLADSPALLDANPFRKLTLDTGKSATADK